MNAVGAGGASRGPVPPEPATAAKQAAAPPTSIGADQVTFPALLLMLASVVSNHGRESPDPGGEAERDESEGVHAVDVAFVSLTAVKTASGDTVDLAPDRVRGLDPRFLAPLRRVAERLATEHGMRLDVVEGVRSPERQSELYAQGRTAPGPVVTWTTNSLHLDGLAADVRIDGEPPVGEAARILADVARQEGLRTLFPFDSGHIELPGVRRGDGPESRSDPPLSVPLPGPAGRPKARIASPAPVAVPARPAIPGLPGGQEAFHVAPATERGSGVEAVDPMSGSLRWDKTVGVEVVAGRSPGAEAAWVQSARGRPDTAPVGLVVRDAGVDGGGRAGAQPGGGDGERRRPEHDPKDAGGRGQGQVIEARTTDGRDGNPWAALLSGGRGGVGAYSADGPALSGGARVAAALEQVEPPHSGRIYVDVPIREGADSGSIRVGVYLGRVMAEVRVPDSELVDRLARNIHELRRDLRERGIEAGAISLRVLHAAQDDATRPETAKRFAQEEVVRERRAETEADGREARDQRGHKERGAGDERRSRERNA